MTNRKERVTDSLVLFWGGIYSNWAKTPFDYKGIHFSSGEQFLMYAKAMLFKDDDVAKKIMATNDVAKIKQYGREVRDFVDKTWESQRLGIAIRGLYAKFSQSDTLKKQMLEDFNFGFRSFVEASPKDDLWGVNLGQNDDRVLDYSQWKGTNLLGTALGFVATRLLIESGHELKVVPMNVAMILSYLANVEFLGSEAGVIKAITSTLADDGNWFFEDYFDYMNLSSSLHYSLRHFLGLEHRNIFFDFTNFKPWELKLNYVTTSSHQQ